MLRSHSLYETFLQNLWEYKDRVTTLKMKTTEGLQYLFDQGISIVLFPPLPAMSLCLTVSISAAHPMQGLNLISYISMLITIMMQLKVTS
jgi:hypothetical protein